MTCVSRENSKKNHELYDRVVDADNDSEATGAIGGLKEALRERIRQVKDQAFEVVPLISEKRTALKA